MMYRFFTILSILVLISCKNTQKSENTENSTYISLEVVKSAGDYYENDDTFLPLPFNISSYKGKEFLILSDRIKKGAVVDVLPIGMARYNDGGSTKNVILSLPKNGSKYQVDNFSSFATLHSSTLWMIEYFLINHSGKLENIHFDTWLDENHAKSYLFNETNVSEK